MSGPISNADAVPAELQFVDYRAKEKHRGLARAAECIDFDEFDEILQNLFREYSGGSTRAQTSESKDAEEKRILMSGKSTDPEG